MMVPTVQAVCAVAVAKCGVAAAVAFAVAVLMPACAVARGSDAVELLSPADGARLVTQHPRFEWSVQSGVPPTHT